MSRPNFRHLRSETGIIGNMIELNVPGRGNIQLKYLLMDVNGTLAVDGILIEGVARRVAALRAHLEIHLLTADTHGRQNLIDQMLGLRAVRIQPGQEATQKADFTRHLGSQFVVAIGQGANDSLMLKEAAIGISVMSIEGLSIEALLSSDLLMPDINTALDLFEKPLRLIASLRK
jgi:P-type E1-E2 ATPase